VTGWTTAEASGGSSCVEVKADCGAVLVRHSQDPDVVLRFTAAEFAAFLHGARAGEFDGLLG
jgi:hypothetical protein